MILIIYLILYWCPYRKPEYDSEWMKIAVAEENARKEERRSIFKKIHFLQKQK